MTRVEAPSRLHFGLLSLPIAARDRTPDAMPVRQYGGVGLMIDVPGVAVRAQPSDEWQAVGPNAERALAFARTFSAALAIEERRPFQIEIERCPEEHTGLGVGTSLGLAVAKALAAESGHPHWSAVELARRIARGGRSAIGIHGFQHGGLIVEAGKLPAEEIAPLIGRYVFPPEWRIVIIRPEGPPIWHGRRERQAFARVPQSNPTEALCRIVLTEMLPALASRDLDSFGEALYEYNSRAGEAFSGEQGGTYAGEEVGEMVSSLRKYGIRGVGQSSWGPTVFALVGDSESAGRICRRIERRSVARVQSIERSQASNLGAICR